MTKNIVIGGGPSGLIWALYHPEYVVFTDKIGGQFNAPFQLGPKYLHKTEYTEKFLKDLNIFGEVNTKIVKVGFFYDGKINPKNTEENRKLYFEKTRGLSDTVVYKSSMSEGNEEFEAFDIDIEDIIKHIYQKIKSRVIVSKVSKVDMVFKEVITENATYPFDNLVVTIPKPIFCRMIEQEEEAKQFVSYPTTFIRSDIKGGLGEFDYVYFSQKETPFHRVSKIPNGEYCFEYKGDDVEKVETEIDRFVLKIGQLVQRKDTITYPQYVKFLGRYANWKHSIKMKEVLEETLS